MEKSNTPQEEALRARAQAEYDRLKAEAAGRDAARVASSGRTSPGGGAAAASEEPGSSQTASDPGSSRTRNASGTPTGQAGHGPEQRTIGSLVASLSSQASSLVRDELEYAQANLKAKVSKLGIGGVFLGVAAFVALYAIGMLFVTIALALASFMPVWAGFLAVTVFLLITTGIFAALGMRKIKASRKHVVSPVSRLSGDVSTIKNGMKKSE